MSISLRQISKSFGDLRALRDVDLDVGDGQVHALLGANGSGKSTLSKCLCGVYQPDAGTLRVGETEVRSFAGPPDAVAAGVRVVHQDSPLLLSMSVLENFAFVHGFPARGSLAPVRWARLRKDVAATLERFGIPIGPDQLAATLTPAERGMVSLALALQDIDAGEAEILVLDEVTAHIPEADAHELLERVRQIPALGVPVLMVTHRFKEVLAFADMATILSNGEVVYGGPAKDLDIGSLVGYMTVATLPSASPDVAGVPSVAVEELADVWRREGLSNDSGEAAIELDEVIGQGVDGVSLRVGRGEIVGIAGLPESGVSELPGILAGSLPRSAGRILVDGHELRREATPADAIALGLMSVPRDRQVEGGAMSLTVRENMILPEAGRFWHRSKYEASVVQRFIDAFDVRPNRASSLFGSLSGGNQQKVVIAKWMISRPKVLVLDNPTAGVDPAARQQLFQIFHDAAVQGLALIVFSSEPEQFAEHCSRVLVLKDGRIAGELSGEDLAAETINQRVTSLGS